MSQLAGRPSPAQKLRSENGECLHCKALLVGKNVNAAYCDAKCRSRAIGGVPETRSCAVCSAQFPTTGVKATCSDVCREVLKLKRRRELTGSVSMGEHLTKVRNPLYSFVCKGCGEPGYKKASGQSISKGQARQWCSRSCWSKHRETERASALLQAEESARAAMRPCQVCGTLASAVIGGETCCAGADCRHEAKRRARVRREREELATTRIVKQWVSSCATCDRDMTSMKGLPKYCSRLCARAGERSSDRYRAAKAMHRAIRKARESSQVLEKFDPVAVFERDGWVCYLCGQATPQALRGTRDQRAPELEHIVPLSKGGSHSMANTACACRGCNMRKGIRSLRDVVGGDI